MSETPAPQYASFNIRMLAISIDLGLLMLIAGPIVDWVVDQMFGPLNVDQFTSMLATPGAVQDTTALLDNLMKVSVDQHTIERSVVDNFLQFVFVAIYTLPFWLWRSTTPGKMLFRLEVRDATTGERMTPRQSVIRFLSYIVSTLPLTLGFVVMFFNKKKQNLHDLIANTVVVVKPKK